jgi:hypothetical protein
MTFGGDVSGYVAAMNTRAAIQVIEQRNRLRKSVGLPRLPIAETLRKMKAMEQQREFKAFLVLPENQRLYSRTLRYIISRHKRSGRQFHSIDGQMVESWLSRRFYERFKQQRDHQAEARTPLPG